MGAATTHAQQAANAALDSTAGITLSVAAELFQVARALGGHPVLAGALADWGASAASREKVVADVFGPTVTPATVSVLNAAVVQRWSSLQDLVAGIEELAVRAASIAAADVDLEGELFQVSRTVADNAQLELALGSRLGESAAKAALVERIFGGRAGEATVLVVACLLQQPRERRMRELLSRAIRIVADQRQRVLAQVTSAQPLTPAQIERLRGALASRYGRAVTVTTTVDPALVGGLRVQVADDVIDASVATRLAELRHKLAG